MPVLFIHIFHLPFRHSILPLYFYYNKYTKKNNLVVVYNSSTKLFSNFLNILYPMITKNILPIPQTPKIDQCGI